MSGRSGLGQVLADNPPEAPKNVEGGQFDLLSDDANPVEAPELPELPNDGEKRSSGRPVGARGRKTDEMVRYLNSFGSGPLVGMAKVVNMVDEAGMPDFRAMGKKFGMKTADAARFWMTCAKELAPYMHQKLPTSIDLGNNSAGSLVVINAGAVVDDPESDPDDLLAGILGKVIDITPEKEEDE